MQEVFLYCSDLYIVCATGVFYGGILLFGYGGRVVFLLLPALDTIVLYMETLPVLSLYSVIPVLQCHYSISLQILQLPTCSWVSRCVLCLILCILRCLCRYDGVVEGDTSGTLHGGAIPGV